MQFSHLNQSALANAEDCMLKGQYTLDPPVWAVRVGGSSRALGTAYHAGLELLYVARLEGRDDPTVDQSIAVAIDVFKTSQKVDLYDNTPIEQFKWDEKVPSEERALEMLHDMLAAYMGLQWSVMSGAWEPHDDHQSHAWPTDWQVLGVEVHTKLDDPQLGVRAKFGADLVLKAPDGGIVCVDNKTAGKPWPQGKSDPRKNVQAPFYLRLARRIYPDAPYYRFVFDVMELPGPRKGVRFERIICDPLPMHEDAIVARSRAFLATYDLVHVQQGLDLPANPNSTLCSPAYCDYFEGCPYGARLEAAA